MTTIKQFKLRVKQGGEKTTSSDTTLYRNGGIAMKLTTKRLISAILEFVITIAIICIAFYLGTISGKQTVMAEAYKLGYAEECPDKLEPIRYRFKNSCVQHTAL